MSTFKTFDEFATFCYEKCFDNVTADYTLCTETHFADCLMYPKRIVDLEYLVPVTVLLVVIFFTGLFGNLSVCTVILKHPSMRSETNMYLFSLAVSDILLLVSGLAPELWYYWNMYPYTFGEFTCRLTKFLSATSTWASALTVVAFSIERYTAICHQSRFLTRNRKRVAIAIFLIWGISIVVALPGVHVYHVVTNPMVTYPVTGEVSLLSRACRMPDEDQYKYYNHLFSFTCVLFFFIPMAVLMLMYIKIALFIRSARQLARNSGIRNNCSEDNKIFKVLVAVVLAFFVCGAPFQYQRLSAIYSTEDEQVQHSDIPPKPCTFKYKIMCQFQRVLRKKFIPKISDIFRRKTQAEEDQDYQRKLFVLTALFYYLSTAVNPILYNAISKRYRKAFKEVLTGKRRQQDVPMTIVARDATKRYNNMDATIAEVTYSTEAT